MSNLRVRLKGKVIHNLTLQEGQTYIAGRKEDCDIILKPEKGISREHFKLQYVDGAWTVEVISRYGEVLHNGDKAQSFTLSHGSIFQIPPYEFDFSINEEQPEAPPENMSYDNLPALSESSTPMRRPEDLQDYEEKTVVGAAPMSAYIKITDANSEPKELIRLDDGESWIAGRESSSHIQIKDQRVSRRQFEIRRQGSQFQIMDLGSVNGTLLNGNPLSSGEFTNLKSGDAISVLDNYLYFELHDSQFQSRLELVQAAPLNHLMTTDSQHNMPMEYQSPSYPMMPYQPQGSMPGEPGAEMATGKLAFIKNFDFQKNRPKVIAAAVIFLAVVYIFSGGDDSSTSGPSSGSGLQTASQQAFAKLSGEQQALVRQRYKDAKNLYMQGKYQLAQDEIIKITEVVADYEDIREIERLSKEAIFIQEQQRRQDQIEKARIETEEKIQAQVAACRKSITPQITSEKIEECLSSILQFNPEHPSILELKAQVESIVEQRMAAAADRASYQAQVERLRGPFNRAQTTYKKGKPLIAISEFDKVVNSSLPDPGGLKAQSKRSIASIRQMLNSKTASLQAEADKLYQSQNLKGAILALRKAQAMDPTNNEIPEKIERHITELRKQMMALYQEGILEESFGNVEGGDNKTGAKDKWKKILELDIPDGEYYKKSYIKLKKYGAL